MKKLRGFSAKVLTMMLAIILLFPAADFTSDAATCQSRIEIGTYKGKGFYQYAFEITGPIEVKLDSEDDYITNIRTSSPALKASLVNSQYYFRNLIGLFTKTPGNYTVSFDIYGGNNVKKQTKRVKVKVYNIAAEKKIIKDVKYAGKSIYGNDKYNYINIPKKGTLKVTINKGFKLKKIQVGRVSAGDRKIKFKNFKNGGKVTLSTLGEKRVNDTSYYTRVSQDMYAVTYVDVYAYDKKNKKLRKDTAYIYKLTNWIN
jgi:hypothetical protein